jgi:hypothetical protein
MRIGSMMVNTFFIENCRIVTVWLGCEQPGALFSNQSKQAPQGL